MRLKRFLCLILCFTLISATFLTFGVNAANVTDAVDITLEHSTGLLNALEITSDIDVVGNAERFVTRGEFASLLSRLALVDINAYGSATSFTDIEGDLVKAAQYVCDMGYLKANGSIFNPDAYINVVETVKAVITMLGYDVRAEAMGATDAHYMELADKIDLTDGVEIYSRDTRINLASLVRLFANALLTPTYNLISTGSETVYGEGETYMEIKYDLHNISGRINANEISGLDRDACGVGEVVIENTSYEVGNTDADNYLGYTVNAYYSLDGNKRTLVYVDTNCYNEIIKLDASDVIYNDYTYEYQPEGSKKYKKIKLATDVEVIINGERIVFDQSKMVPKEGTITLISSDADNDRYIETVIIEDALVGVVKNIDPIAQKLSINSGKGSEIKELNLYEEGYIKVIDQMTNTEKTVNDIKKDMVVTIFENSKSITIYTSLARESGSVSTIKTDGSVTHITLNGEKFEVSPYYYDTRGIDVPKSGDNGRFYLDYYGRVAYFASGADIWNYGWLINATNSGAVFNKTYKFRIFSELDGGTLLVLDAADKVRVNNVYCNADGKDKYGIDLLATLSNNPQIVCYRTNAEGKLSEIEYANDDGIGLEKHNDTKDGFQIESPHESLIFGKKTPLSTDAKVFIIPNDADNGDEQFYRMANYTYFKNQNTKYSYSMYKTDATKMLADIAVIKRSDKKFYTTTIPSVITDICTTLGEDGELMYTVKAIGSNGAVTEYVAPVDTNVFDGMVVGDVVWINVSEGNKAAGCIRLFSYDDFETEPTKDTGLEENESGRAIMKITASRVEDGFIEFGSAGDRKYLNATAASVIVCDMTSKKPNFYKGTLDNIIDIYTYGTGEEFVVKTNYYKADLIVLYKK